MSDAPSLLVVSGPPGAGKSTIAALLADRLSPSVLVDGDAFFGFLRAGAVAPWLPDSHAQNTVVIDASATATGRFAVGGMHTVFDGVVGPWFVQQFLAATGLDSLEYLVLLPPVEVCAERVRTRARHGRTDEAATRHMHAEFARHLPEGASGDLERHVLRAVAPLPEIVGRVEGMRAEGLLALVRS